MRRLLLPLLAGALYAIPFLAPALFLPAWVAFVPLLWVIKDADLKDSLFYGWLMGTVCHLIGYPWLVNMFIDFGHLPWIVGLFGYLLFCAYQGLCFGLTGLIARWLQKRTKLPLGLALPLALVTTEHIFPMIFPSYAANSQFGFHHLIQIADLGGVLLVSLLVGLINGTLFESLSAKIAGAARPKKMLVTCVTLLTLALIYGTIRIKAIGALAASAPKLSIGLIQGNIGAADTHIDPVSAHSIYRAMTFALADESKPDLIVWPESAYMEIIDETADLRVVTGGAESHVLMGCLRARPLPSGRMGLINSLVLVSPQGQAVDAYGKIKLLVFGEYLPFGDIFPKLYDLFPYTGHFLRGENLLPLAMGDWRLSVNICYEDIWPGLIRKLMRSATAPQAHVLINATNDSWYGRSFEQWEHLSLAAWRAIEHRRWLARATNTGYSAFVDATGRIVTKSGIFTRETLVHDVPMLEGRTLYGILGDWVGWLTLGLIILARFTAGVR
ncbi:MAG: apolipoprotein N-acyltransferase [Elusimicrobiota bacterium]